MHKKKKPAHADTSDSVANWHMYFCQRPYCVECTRSHPNSEVNRRKARSVLGWGTAWEALRVLLAYCYLVSYCLRAAANGGQCDARVGNQTSLPGHIFASGHTASNTPDPIRTRKLSGARPGQYWGGGPPGKPFGCCWLFLSENVAAFDISRNTPTGLETRAAQSALPRFVT